MGWQEAGGLLGTKQGRGGQGAGGRSWGQGRRCPVFSAHPRGKAPGKEAPEEEASFPEAQRWTLDAGRSTPLPSCLGAKVADLHCTINSTEYPDINSTLLYTKVLYAGIVFHIPEQAVAAMAILLLGTTAPLLMQVLVPTHLNSRDEMMTEAAGHRNSLTLLFCFHLSGAEGKSDLDQKQNQNQNDLPLPSRMKS